MLTSEFTAYFIRLREENFHFFYQFSKRRYNVDKSTL